MDLLAKLEDERTSKLTFAEVTDQLFEAGNRAISEIARQWREGRRRLSIAPEGRRETDASSS